MLMPIYTPLKAVPVATLNFVGFTASGSAGSTLENTTQFSYSGVSVGSNEGADRIILVASVTTGGGAGTGIRPGRAGGSGIVILKYPNSFTINQTGGLSMSTANSGDYKVTSITSGSGNVYWS